MKKTILLSLMASSLMMAQNNTILDSEFTFDPSIAILAGAMKNDNNNADWKTLSGIELGFNCLATDTIRQQVQLTNFKDNNLKVLQVNINPHYIVALNDTIKFGFGPTLGFATIDNGVDTDTVFTYGMGTNLSLNVNENIFLGTEIKYEFTQDASLSGVNNDIDNMKVFAKIGYQF